MKKKNYKPLFYRAPEQKGFTTNALDSGRTFGNNALFSR